MAYPSCSPPKAQGVKPHTRSRPRQIKRAAAKRAASSPYVVRNTQTGTVVSRHKTWTAAVNARKRRDLASYRAGRGRPFEVQKRGT